VGTSVSRKMVGCCVKDVNDRIAEERMVEVADARGSILRLRTRDMEEAEDMV